MRFLRLSGSGQIACASCHDPDLSWADGRTVAIGTLRRKLHQKDDPLFPTKSPLLEPLYLNRQDLLALKAFLEFLSEPPLRIHPTELPTDGEVAAKK